MVPTSPAATTSLQLAPPLPLRTDRIAHVSHGRGDLGWGGVREIVGDDLIEQAINALHIVREAAVSQHRIDDQHRQPFVVGVHQPSLNVSAVEV